MLHEPVAKYNYFGTATGCCAKICRIFKAIMFFLFGQFGYCLGKAQDKRISIEKEYSLIADYEKKLAAVVASLPREGIKGSSELDTAIKNLYFAYKARQAQVATLNNPAWSSMEDGVIADLTAKINEHNEQNSAKIDLKYWIDYIRDAVNGMNGDNGIQTTLAANFVTGYVPFVTPKRIEKDGLKVVAEFADLYIKLHNGINVHPTGAAILLRHEIAVDKKREPAFSNALKALPKEKNANQVELAKLFTYFTAGFKMIANRDEFIEAVFPEPKQAATT